MKNSILFIACALMISGSTYGQKLSTIPKATALDTGSYFNGVENVSGVFTTKLFRASLMIPYISDTVADTPGGVTNSIQMKSSTNGFAGTSDFTYDGTAFQVGFPASTNHFTITTAGQCQIAQTDLVSMSSSMGHLYFDADPLAQVYHFGYPASGMLTIDAANGKDTLSGILVMPDLAGNGPGVMSVANDGTLGWTAAGGGGPSVVASNDQLNRTATLPTFATYNPNNSIYSVGGYITVNSVAGGTVTMQVAYKNEAGSAVSKSLFATGQTTAAVSSTGSYYFPDMQFRATPGTLITVSYTVTGTINYNPGATIMYVRP